MTMNEILKELNDYFMNESGDETLAPKYMDELKRLGLKAGDTLQVYAYAGEEIGGGKINGKSYGEDGNNCELSLYWQETYFEDWQEPDTTNEIKVIDTTVTGE